MSFTYTSLKGRKCKITRKLEMIRCYEYHLVQYLGTSLEVLWELVVVAESCILVAQYLLCSLDKETTFQK